MRTFGIYLLIFGVGSVILSFLDLNFKIMVWIDLWGPTIGWLIRLAFIGIGGALYFGAPEPEGTLQESGQEE